MSWRGILKNHRHIESSLLAPLRTYDSAGTERGCQPVRKDLAASPYLPHQGSSSIPSHRCQTAPLILAHTASLSLALISKSSASEMVDGMNFAGHNPVASASPVNFVPSISSSTTGMSGYLYSSSRDFHNNFWFLWEQWHVGCTPCFINGIVWPCWISGSVWSCWIIGIVWPCWIIGIVWPCSVIGLKTHVLRRWKPSAGKVQNSKASPGLIFSKDCFWALYHTQTENMFLVGLWRAPFAAQQRRKLF